MFSQGHYPRNPPQPVLDVSPGAEVRSLELSAQISDFSFLIRTATKKKIVTYGSISGHVEILSGAGFST